MEDGTVLLRAGRFAGAYYMLGYSVECALKAAIAKQIREHDFPDRQLILDSYTHDLSKLLRLSGRRAEFEARTAADQSFGLNWTVAKDWTETTRYSVTITDVMARDLYTSDHGPKQRSAPMAQDVVVRESLDDALIRDGAALIQKLDDAGWPVAAALWLYSSDANRWRLVVASPPVGTLGPRDAYAAVQRALGTLDLTDGGLALDDVVVVGGDYPLIELLRMVLRTGPVISRIRFTRTVISGHFIDDALIYRIT